MADRRHVDSDGEVWASRYEQRVYAELHRVLGDDVRRCGEGDTVTYTTPVRAGLCVECGSSGVVQQRTYTPDLWVSDPLRGDAAGGYFIESKGHWPAHKRNLLRNVARCNPDLPVVLVFQNDGWVTKGKTRYSDYAARYLKDWPVVIWKDFLKKPKDLYDELKKVQEVS